MNISSSLKHPERTYSLRVDISRGCSQPFSDENLSENMDDKNPQVDINIDALQVGEQQLRNIIKIIVQACLEVPQLNLSAVSKKEGGFART